MKRILFLALAWGLLAATVVRAADKNPVVLIDTSLGAIKVELDPEMFVLSLKTSATKEH